MLAKFQNILVDAEKVDDLPMYHLSLNNKNFGSICLDTQMFTKCLSTDNDFGNNPVIKFNFDPSDFVLLNYDIIDKNWILNIMEVKKLDVHNIAEIAGVSDSTVYRILEGKEISGAIKASLFNFFNK